MSTTPTPTPRILVVGGGYVGMYAALRLRRRLRRGEATVTVVDPSPTMTYQPFLAEAAAGSVEPRHVVVPLRRVLRGCEVVTASVTSVDVTHRVALAVTDDGEELELPYDVLVMAPGSLSRRLSQPGLASGALSFSSLRDAVHLRNRVLGRLDAASATRDPDRRRAALTFTVVGGGYSGVELLAELEDMARYAVRHHEGLAPGELRWVLLEARERLLPEVSPAMAAYTRERLLRRGIDVRLETTLTSYFDGRVVLSDGTAYDCDTVVTTIGTRAHPLVARLGLPVNHRGQLLTAPDLRVSEEHAVWAAGDAAAVPDLTADEPGTVCGPSAQHAVRQGRRLADNLVADLRARPTKPYRHRYAGSVASLGLHRGVAEVYGVRLRGWPAWVLHRVYHLSRMPTLNRKVRVLADWTLASLFSREVVSLGWPDAGPRRLLVGAAQSMSGDRAAEGA